MPLKERQPNTARPPVHGAPCSIGQLYRVNLDDADEIDQIDSVLFREGNDASQAWQILHDHGYSVSYQMINKHRGSGGCRCFKIDKDLWCLTCHRDHAHCGCA